ncbi:hypothetical protein PC119_g21101 [Phytophthora cactorum]|nr:hypothetical protein PC114_g21455 [Phytophthora cactorum]KAG2898726.1 hypothetical protein PC117_g22451 [Phytophthora cactorum]KAG2981129.1 hypothetical protein PC119_g21101 [Phytophthora cactorum]KAG3132293.1 hypothetical protein C6341_g22979 [Phytophthora cactorum]
MDAALACSMWHSFGRSSDLGYIQKQHVSVSADGVFYLRLLRVTTAEEQGLTLVPDKNNFLTCPIHALAVASATQDAPCGSLLSQLPELMEADPGTLNVALAAPSSSVTVSTTSGVSLTDTAAAASPRAPGPTPSSPATLHLISRSKEPTRGEDGVQAYVNRLLKRVVTPARATEDLTSHSFCRGGAPHANGEEKLAAQWIFDRGAWDMTKVNKASAYVFNTPQEDCRVARVLSGWGVNETPVVEDVETLDHDTQEQVARLQELLYSSCSGLKERRFNVSRKVLAVLTAYLIKYFPELKALSPSAPIGMRVEEGLDAVGIARADMLAWSAALNISPPRHDKQDSENEDKSRECKGYHHSAVINGVIVMNKSMAARLTILEAALLKPKRKHAADEEQQQQQAQSDQEAKPKRRKNR